MATEFGTLYQYAGITDINYGLPGRFHTVQRPDSQLMIAAKNETYAMLDTLISVQVCLGDTVLNSNWFYLLSGISVSVVEDGNGRIITAPLSGMTAIRIIPADDSNTFQLSVREFFPSEKINLTGNNEYLVT